MLREARLTEQRSAGDFMSVVVITLRRARNFRNLSTLTVRLSPRILPRRGDDLHTRPACACKKGVPPFDPGKKGRISYPFTWQLRPSWRSRKYMYVLVAREPQHDGRGKKCEPRDAEWPQGYILRRLPNRIGVICVFLAPYLLPAGLNKKKKMDETL